MNETHSAQPSKGHRPKYGVARALSKLGFCSRSNAVILVRAGRVKVNDRLLQDPEFTVNLQSDRVAVDGREISVVHKIYLMLNKPRGLVTTMSDEQGRETVYQCLAGHELPHVVPVGRLDKASEGLLFFTNDTQWAVRLTDPKNHLDKTYHVQINRLADEGLIRDMLGGVSDGADFLTAKRARILRLGEKNSWLEIVLDEGKNRHIRRLLKRLNVEVLRLVRVAIGGLHLGSLPKGSFRFLTPEETDQFPKNF